MMKKIACALLLAAGIGGNLHAQNTYEAGAEAAMKISNTERTFDGPVGATGIRDFVRLPTGKLILEMNNMGDWDRIAHLDSILVELKRDVAFYKDSLAHFSGNVRIDYALAQKAEYKQIRFLKHDPNGAIFVNKYGIVAPLKMEQDTVRVIIKMNGEEIPRKIKPKGSPVINTTLKTQYQITCTFCLNNYTDIDKFFASREELTHILDTLRTTRYKRSAKDAQRNPSSTVYKPMSQYDRLDRYNFLVKSDVSKRWRNVKNNDMLVLDGHIGAGLVMNTLAPMAELGMSLKRDRGDKDYVEGGFSLSSYYFFEKNPAGASFIKDNWFLNGEVGLSFEDSKKGKYSRLTGGAGFLIRQQGDYFKGPTFKVFTNIQLKNTITISPELIITNNLRQVFPGITVKVF